MPEIDVLHLPVLIEEVDGCYQATSPALDGLLVLADTADEALALAPAVAEALLEAMQSRGVPLGPHGVPAQARPDEGACR